MDRLSIYGLLFTVGAAATESIKYIYSQYRGSENETEESIGTIEDRQQKMYQFLFGIDESTVGGHAERTEDEMNSIIERLDRIEANTNENTEAIKANTEAIEQESEEREEEHKKVVGMMEEVKEEVEDNSKAIRELK